MRPATVQEAAETIAQLSREHRSVQVLGAATKLDWNAHKAAEVTLETGSLARILEHNRGDFTAVLEAGVPLHEAQTAFAEADQMLAWDPPLYAGGSGPAGGDKTASRAGAATVGGIVATSDCGPARHRYGGVRDTLIGITVVLSDGTVARAGGKVIKNVAGYDLGKLFTGSFGTLGMIATISVRLHPLLRETATVIGSSDAHERLAAVAADLARRPLEAECLDLRWSQSSGLVLVRFAGKLAQRRAHETARDLALEDVRVLEEDGPLWELQRSMQRSRIGAVLKVSARPSELAGMLGAARRVRASVVARAALGLAWVAFEPERDSPQGLAERVAELRRALGARACVPLDGAGRYHLQPALIPDGVLALTGRIKQRLDPAGSFPPAPGATQGAR